MDDVRVLIQVSRLRLHSLVILLFANVQHRSYIHTSMATLIAQRCKTHHLYLAISNIHRCVHIAYRINHVYVYIHVCTYV